MAGRGPGRLGPGRRRGGPVPAPGPAGAGLHGRGGRRLPRGSADAGGVRQMFPDAFQLIPRRKTFSDRAFVRGIEANQFDSLDKVFADYLRSKYTEDEAMAEKLVARAAHYFGEEAT